MSYTQKIRFTWSVIIWCLEGIADRTDKLFGELDYLRVFWERHFDCVFAVR